LDVVVDGMINAFHKLFMEGATKILNVLATFAANIFEINQTNALVDLFTYVGWILLLVGILFAISNFAIRSMEGNSDGLNMLIVNIFVSLLIMYFLYPVAKFMFVDLQKTVLGAIKIIFTDNKISVSDMIFGGLSLTGTFGDMMRDIGVLWVFVLSIFLFYIVFSILIQIIKRSGVFIIQVLIGYLHIFSIPQGSYGGFISWARFTFGILISQIIQWSLYFLGLNLVSDLANKKEPISQFLLGLGVLLAAKEVDRYMRYFGLFSNNSLKLGATNAIRNISSVVSKLSTK